MERVPNLLDFTESFTYSPFWSSLTFMHTNPPNLVLLFPLNHIPRTNSSLNPAANPFHLQPLPNLLLLAHITSLLHETSKWNMLYLSENVSCPSQSCPQPWDQMESSHGFFIHWNNCSASLLLSRTHASDHSEGGPESMRNQKFCVGKDFDRLWTELMLTLSINIITDGDPIRGNTIKVRMGKLV